ncbi:MAG: Uma2 family endonuclease [Myxococcales bacterium]|nr:Uma2 family endonuclease [Myxococcales bacterium]
MEPARVARLLLSEEKYLAQERATELKHEFVNGEVTNMAGASPLHNLIASNITRALGNLLAGRCVALGSDQRVHVAATGLYTYPDVTVVCGQPEIHAKDSWIITNPSLIVEVLSPSTEAHDRGAKFAHYRNLASLQAYLLVAQSERRVEHFRRIERGEWVLTEYLDDAVVSLSTLGVQLPLAEIYRDAELFPAASPDLA